MTTPFTARVRRLSGYLLAGASALAVGLVVHRTGPSWAAILRAAAGAALMYFPIGDLLLPPARDALGRWERVTLASCAGCPLSAALYYACALVHLPISFRIVWALFAVAALGRRARWTPETESAAGTRPAVLALAVLVPLLSWVLLRDATVFVPTPAGLLYDFTVDDPDQMAYYWELLRGVPPQQVPMLAGLPAGRYHLLGFMPGLFFIREMGLDVTEVHHVVSPALRILLLMGALYVAVRLATRQAALAAAALLSVLGVSVAVGNLTEGRFVDAASAFSFFMTNESGGSGIVVWTTIAALLFLRERLTGTDRRRTLMLASALAGLSYGFKAQAFLLMAAAYGAALVVVWARDRDPALPAAAALTLGSAATVFFSWRAPMSRGLPLLTPGLFARLYVRPALAADRVGGLGAALASGLDRLPSGLADLLATALGVWRMAGLSVFVVAWVARAAWRWRTRGLAELTLALMPVLALPLGYAFSVKAMDGAVSPYEFIQAAQGLAVLAGAVNVVVVAALLARVTVHSATWTLAITAAAASTLIPTLVSGKTIRTPHRDAVLSADEACALLYLRNLTPLDGVVITSRGEGVPPGSRRLNYHPLVSGLAGRRSVLEEFWREVDTGPERVRAVRRLFETSDAAEGDAILRRFRVTHVLSFAGRPLRFSSPELVPVYRHGAVTVYRFGPDEGGRLPPWMPAAFGLTCSGGPT